MVTDRDICMGSYIQGRSLQLIQVQDVMGSPVVSCEPEDDLVTVEKLIRDTGSADFPYVTWMASW